MNRTDGSEEISVAWLSFIKSPWGVLRQGDEDFVKIKDFESNIITTVKKQIQYALELNYSFNQKCFDILHFIG